jgi:hypothetical protein
MTAPKTKKIFIVEVSLSVHSTETFDNITIDDVKERFLSIIEGTKRIGMKHPQYVRRLLVEGKLEGIKIVERGRYKWYITKTSIDRYKKAHNKINQKRRYILRIKADDEEKVRHNLNLLAIDYELELAYKSKAKPYD